MSEVVKEQIQQRLLFAQYKGNIAFVVVISLWISPLARKFLLKVNKTIRFSRNSDN